MIAVPFNDLTCLGTITEAIAARVEQHDQALVDVAAKYKTTDALIEWIRSLPQRDDDGDNQNESRGSGRGTLLRNARVLAALAKGERT